MSRVPYGVVTPEQRDQAAEDCDEAARQRDRTSAARDQEADERDGRGEARTQEAVRYTRPARRLVNATAQQVVQPGANQPVVHALLRHMDQTLQDVALDRQAAVRDRRDAAADRNQSAEDRFIKAAHRAQAAIERAQQPLHPVLLDHGRWSDLYAGAQAARTRSEALCQQARALNRASLPEKEVLLRSELARLRARLATMPVIEQAKGVIIAQNGCSDTEAFDLLRQASQRLNQPVRDLADRIVTGARDKRHPPAGQAKTPAGSSSP